MIKPMLCSNNLDKFLQKTNEDNIIIQPKLDGVRCIAKVEKNKIVYYSRNGKVFKNFQKFNPILYKFYQTLVYNQLNPPFYFDGEIIANDFQDLMTQVHRLEDVNDTELSFHIFDIINNEIIQKPLWYRDVVLHWCFRSVSVDELTNLKVNKVYLYNLQDFKFNILLQDKLHNKSIKEQLEIIAQYFIDRGYEGIVVKDYQSIYEEKRSNYWIKIKQKETIDLPVIKIVEGKGKYEGMLGAFICKLPNGKTVSIGSGLKDEERKLYFKQIPKMIEVEYQSMTKEGNLRFPIFKRIRQDKEEN